MNEKSSSMKGKNVIITGSSRGIGYYTAMGLAKKGAHVIIVSHNEARSKKAVQRISRKVGSGSADFYVADLSSQKDIRRLAELVKSHYEHIDVLINNVGGWFRKYQHSPDGIEMTFALNHLSYFLLTGLLIDLLKASSPARIVNVASDAHEQADQIHFEDIGFENGFRPYLAYAQSKLANIIFTYSLADRLEGTEITANALHPGFVSSHLYRDFGILTGVIDFFADIFGKSPEEGAQTSIYLASVPEVANVSGKYFVDKQPERSSPVSYDKEQAQRLWELSEKMTDFEYPV